MNAFQELLLALMEQEKGILAYMLANLTLASAKFITQVGKDETPDPETIQQLRSALHSIQALLEDK